MSNVLFSGIIPALVTPLDRAEHINEDTARRLMRWHLDAGADGFYILGATGEGPVVAPGERMKLAEIAREETRARGAKAIIHVGAVDLTTAKSLARHAGEIGADAISSVPPFFFGYGEKEIAQYYTELAEAADLPLIMYCSPLAGIQITYDMVGRFLRIPHAIGVKWTSYDYYTMHRIKSLQGGDVNVLNGPDETLLCGLSMGADGGIGGTYNVMPKVFRAIYDNFRAGDIAAAQQWQYKANQLIDVILRFGVQPSLKEILGRLGFDCGHCVYPQKQLTEEERAGLFESLDALDYEREYL